MSSIVYHFVAIALVIAIPKSSVDHRAHGHQVDSAYPSSTLESGPRTRLCDARELFIDSGTTSSRGHARTIPLTDGDVETNPREDAKPQRKSEKKKPVEPSKKKHLLGLELTVELLSRDTSSSILVSPESHVFQAGDKVRFRFRAKTEGRLYLLAENENTQLLRLVPSTDAGLENAVSKEKEVVFPANSSYFEIPGGQSERLLYVYLTGHSASSLEQSLASVPELGISDAPRNLDEQRGVKDALLASSKSGARELAVATGPPAYIQQESPPQMQNSSTDSANTNLFVVVTEGNRSELVLPLRLQVANP